MRPISRSTWPVLPALHRRLVPLHLLSLAPALLCALLTTSAARCPAATKPSAAPTAPGDEQALPEELEAVRLINEFRARGGLPALDIDPRLVRAARGHARRMAFEDRLDHVLGGAGPDERAAAEGFRGGIFENVAGGTRASPLAVVGLWIGSTPHRDNMLAVRTGVVGVGFARSPGGDKDYYTAMFAATP